MSSERRKGDGWAIHPNGRGAVGHPSRPGGTSQVHGLPAGERRLRGRERGPRAGRTAFAAPPRRRGAAGTARRPGARGVRGSGRPVAELTVDAIRREEITLTDVRIHPTALDRQAAVAQAHGNPQLAENLRRAAELTVLPDEEVLAIYAELRPGRSAPGQLTSHADSLERRGLVRCAALVREAAAVYARRGLSG